jgi:hypothetical protein
MMPGGYRNGIETAQFSHCLGLQSDLDPAGHMLPESLVELWRREKVPTASLPALCHAITPRLITEDFYLVLNQSIKDNVVLPAIAPAAILALMSGVLSGVAHHFSLLLVIVYGIGGAIFGVSILWLVRQPRRNRRVQQMKWLMAAHAGVPLPPLPGRVRSMVTRFATLFVAILFFVLLGIAAAVAIYWYRGWNS